MATSALLTSRCCQENLRKQHNDVSTNAGQPHRPLRRPSRHVSPRNRVHPVSLEGVGRTISVLLQLGRLVKQVEGHVPTARCVPEVRHDDSAGPSERRRRWRAAALSSRAEVGPASAHRRRGSARGEGPPAGPRVQPDGDLPDDEGRAQVVVNARRSGCAGLGPQRLAQEPSEAGLGGSRGPLPVGLVKPRLMESRRSRLVETCFEVFEVRDAGSKPSNRTDRVGIPSVGSLFLLPGSKGLGADLSSGSE